MTFIKNDTNASERWVHFGLVHKDNGLGITVGSVNVHILQNGATSAVRSLTAATDHVINGIWKLQLTQADLNSETVTLIPIATNAVPSFVSIKTSDFTNATLYAGITALQAGVNITEVNGVTFADINSFKASTTGLSTFDHTVNQVIAGNTVAANIVEVNGVTFADIDSFKADVTGITASFTGIVDANIVQTVGVSVAAISDFHGSTFGLSTFNHTTDFVGITSGGIDNLAFTTSAIDRHITRLFGTNIDSTVAFSKIMEMLLAFMAGQVTVTDQGDTRYFSFKRRGGSVESFGITASELDSIEGQRSAEGNIS
jgi:hypothetical protein